MNQNARLDSVAAEFYSKCSPNFDFPLGGNVPIPLASELGLAEFLLAARPLTVEQLAPVRKALTLRQAYLWVIFSVRIAVHAVRTSTDKLIEASICGILIQDCLVDWRDLLIALALVEDCAHHLGADFNQILDRKIGLGSEKLRETIVEGYLSRSTDMRSSKIMGFASHGKGLDFGYSKIA